MTSIDNSTSEQATNIRKENCESQETDLWETPTAVEGVSAMTLLIVMF